MSRIEELTLIFNEADKDCSGVLSFDELRDMMLNSGYHVSDGRLRELLRHADTSGDNEVSLQEYLVGMGEVEEDDHQAAQMRRLFRQFDLDGSGQIDKGELKKVFSKMNKHFTDSDLDRMIALSDKDGSGTLDQEEFIARVFGKKK